MSRRPTEMDLTVQCSETRFGSRFSRKQGSGPCQYERTGPTAMSDIHVMNQGLAGEHFGIAAYAAALGSGLLDESVAGVARPFGTTGWWAAPGQNGQLGRSWTTMRDVRVTVPRGCGCHMAASRTSGQAMAEDPAGQEGARSAAAASENRGLTTLVRRRVRSNGIRDGDVMARRPWLPSRHLLLDRRNRRA